MGVVEIGGKNRARECQQLNKKRLIFLFGDYWMRTHIMICSKSYVMSQHLYEIWVGWKNKQVFSLCLHDESS